MRRRSASVGDVPRCRYISETGQARTEPDELRSAGVEILFESAVDDSGNAWVHFRAPDGNIYEFTQDPASPDRTEGLVGH
jgi:hypothetical protein